MYCNGLLTDFKQLIKVGRYASDDGLLLAIKPDENLAIKLNKYYQCFGKNYKHYFEDALNEPAYLAAAYLDPSTWDSVDDFDVAERFIRLNLATYEETETPINQDRVMTEKDFMHLPPGLRKRKVDEANRLRSDGALSSSNGGQSAIDKEFGTYIDLVSKMDKLSRYSTDPLIYWPTKMKSICPILYRCASILLAVQPCESDAERLFSAGRRTFTVERAALNSRTGAMLTTVRSWMIAELDDDDSKRTEKRKERAARFATLVATDRGLDLLDAKDPTISVEEESEAQVTAVSSISVFDKTEYNRAYGDILPFPINGLKDIAIGASVAVYFVDIDDWCAGNIVDIHRGYVNQDNAVVEYPDGNWTHCFTKDTYGPRLDWVLVESFTDAPTTVPEEPVGAESFFETLD